MGSGSRLKVHIATGTRLFSSSRANSARVAAIHTQTLTAAHTPEYTPVRGVGRGKGTGRRVRQRKGQEQAQQEMLEGKERDKCQKEDNENMHQ